MYASIATLAMLGSLLGATVQGDEQPWEWGLRKIQYPVPFRSISARSYTFQPHEAPNAIIPNLVAEGNPPRLPDGTTKTRTTDDTLPSEGPAKLTSDDSRYTTLDRLFRERGYIKAPPKPPRSLLGGLHPDEVYYADENVIIIKGGGFHKPAVVSLEEGDENDVEDNEILEGSFDKHSPSTIWLQTPSIHTEYNGNIPSIVPAPVAQKGRSLTPLVYPGAYYIHQYAPSQTYLVPAYQPLQYYNYDVDDHDDDSEEANVQKRGIAQTYRQPHQLQPANTHYQQHIKPSPNRISKPRVEQPYTAGYATVAVHQPQLQYVPVQLPGGATNQPQQQPQYSADQVEVGVRRQPVHRQPVQYVQLHHPVAAANTHAVVGSQRQHYASPTRPISLAGDTRVNYLRPRPAYNHDAEWLSRDRHTVAVRQREPLTNQRHRHPVPDI